MFLHCLFWSFILLHSDNTTVIKITNKHGEKQSHIFTEHFIYMALHSVK